MQQIVNQDIKKFIEYSIIELYKLPLDEAILQAEQIGLLLRDNAVGIYSLNEVESYLIDSFNSIFSKLQGPEVADYDPNKKILFVATELYHTGGHTRLMERLSIFLDSKPDLLITRQISESIIEREEVLFSNILYDINGKSSIIDKTFLFLNVILKYNLVILNIHPEDIYAIVACGLAKKINKKIKIYFVNHADHTFSYGSSIADVWYEISAHGRAIDLMRDLTAKKCFLGIPIDTKIFNVQKNYKFEDGDLILSAASRHKYKPINGQSIMPLVDALLNRFKKSSFQVIGVNVIRDYWWWGLKFKFGKRLILSESIPYEDYLKVTCNSKLYIDSHPLPGGTAFAEQLLQGRLCSGLDSLFQGYSPVEKFKRNTVSDVLCLIETVNENDVLNVYQLIDEYHSFENVKSRFKNSIFSYENEQAENYTEFVGLNIISFESKFKIISSRFKFHSFKQVKFMFYASSNITFVMYVFKSFLRMICGK